MSNTITIRVAGPADAEAVQVIYAPVVTDTAISFEQTPPTAGEMRQCILDTLESYPYLVAEREGVVVGYAYASQHRARAAYRWAVDVTVYIAQDARRCGVGHRLYQVLLPLLARQGFCSAYAGIALPNEGSVRLHERQRFIHIGTFPQVGFKHGTWHDVGYWRASLNEQSTSPSEPIRFSDLGAAVG